MALLISASQNPALIKQVFPYFVAWIIASVSFIRVSIWRCSKNTTWVGWGNLAQIVVLISFINAFLEMLAFFKFAPAVIANISGISVRLIVGCAVLTVLYFFFFVVRGQLKKEGIVELEPEVIVKAKSAYISRNYKEV